MRFDYLEEIYKGYFEEMEDALLGAQSMKWWYNYPEGEYSTPFVPEVGTELEFIPVILTNPINYELVLKNQDSSFWNLGITFEDV